MAYEYDCRPVSPQLPALRPDGFEVAGRQGDCDIRRPVPKPILQDDDARYEDISARAEGRARLGGGEVGPEEKREAKASGVFSALGWSVAALVVLWLFAVSAPFLANALTQHGWRLWASLLIGCIPLAFVLGLLVYAALRFRKLPRVEQLRAASYTNKAELQIGRAHV